LITFGFADDIIDRTKDVKWKREIHMKIPPIFLLLTFYSISICGQKPELVLPIGHTDGINSVCFSPDGRYVLSGSDDKTIKLWDIQNGNEIITFKGHTSQVRSVCFSPDGKNVLSGSWDGTLKLWDIQNVKEIKSIEAGWINSVCYTPDGRYVLTGSSDLTNNGRAITLWDIKNGKEIKSFNSHTKEVISVSISPNGRYILSGSSDKTLILWDIQNGKELKSFIGHTSGITSVCFSPDSRYALSGSDDTSMKLWDIQTGKEVRSFRGHTFQVSSVCFSPDGRYALSGSGDNKMKLWDIQTGKEVKSFEGHTIDVQSVCFSPNGRYALSGSFDKTIILWDIQSGKIIKSLKGHSSEITSVCFSPDGRYFALGLFDHTNKLWDIQRGSMIKFFKSRGSWDCYTSISFSPNGEYILSGIDNKNMELWDIKCNKMIKYFKGHNEWVGATCFSNDGRYALSGSWDKTLILWDIQSGKEIKSFKGHSDIVNSVCFSPDDRFVLSGSRDHKIILWDVHNGNKIKSFNAKFQVESVFFSPNGKYALSRTWDNILELWDIHSGKEIISFEGPWSGLHPVCFSPNSRYILYGSWDNKCRLWDIQSSKVIKSFDGHTDQVTSICITNDGQLILSGSKDKTLKLWDIQNGEEIQTFYGQTDQVNSVCFSPDNHYAISGSRDNTAILWDIRNKKEVVTFIPVDSTDFISLTPDYYYYCSKNASNKLCWRIGLNIFDFSQFDLQYNRPDIVLERIGYAPKELIDSYRKAYYKRLKKMNFDENKFSPEFHVPKIKILNIDNILPTADRKLLAFKIKVTDSKNKIDRINLWLNDVPIYGMNGINLRRQNKDSLVMDIPVNLSQGENKVQVSCLNEKGVESLKETIEISYEPSKPEKTNVYFVGIGVSDYKDPKLKLTYSSKDIRDLAAIFKKKNADLITDTLLDSRVTRENVRNLKKKLYNTKIDDEVILAISGHGFLSDSLDFYYGTYDIDYTHPEVRGLSYDDIEWLLDSIPARKKLVLMDACHSGEVDKEGKLTAGETFANNEKGLSLIPDSSSIGLQNSFELMQELFTNLSKGNGAVVISAARGQGAALEGKEWNNGVFTHCIMEGLKEGHVSVNALKDYVSKEVEALTNGRQKPTSRAENLENNWRIW